MRKKIKLALASRDRRQNFEFMNLILVFFPLNMLPKVAPVTPILSVGTILAATIPAVHNPTTVATTSGVPAEQGNQSWIAGDHVNVEFVVESWQSRFNGTTQETDPKEVVSERGRVIFGKN
jgi:hypothetical protein